MPLTVEECLRRCATTTELNCEVSQLTHLHTPPLLTIGRVMWQAVVWSPRGWCMLHPRIDQPIQGYTVNDYEYQLHDTLQSVNGQCGIHFACLAAQLDGACVDSIARDCYHRPD